MKKEKRLVISEARQKLLDVVGYSYLFIIPNKRARLLNPIRLSKSRTCVITGREIPEGDYAYPCHANPVRLSPTGPERCLISAALRKGEKILPKGEGIDIISVPTSQQLYQLKKVKTAKGKLRKELEKEGKKLLTGKSILLLK